MKRRKRNLKSDIYGLVQEVGFRDSSSGKTVETMITVGIKIDTFRKTDDAIERAEKRLKTLQDKLLGKKVVINTIE